METKLVKDLMLPLSEYAVVSAEATLKEALVTLKSSQAQLPQGRPPHRAVLVADFQGDIVGRLGQLGFLEALEPKYKVLGDIAHLSQAGLSEEFVNTIMDNYRFWRDNFEDVSRRACTVKVKQVMRPAAERIDENASLPEAIHLFVMARSHSVLVTSQETVVGILRLSDLFVEVAGLVVQTDCQ
jgi:CBS domain-containing protein